MLPAVLLAGVLLVRKLRQSEMVLLFIAASLVTVCIISLLQGLSVTKELRLLLVESPIFFFAAIMLTEPLTLPPTQKLKNLYGVIIGILFIPQIISDLSTPLPSWRWSSATSTPTLLAPS